MSGMSMKVSSLKWAMAVVLVCLAVLPVNCFNRGEGHGVRPRGFVALRGKRSLTAPIKRSFRDLMLSAPAYERYMDKTGNSNDLVEGPLDDDHQYYDLEAEKAAFYPLLADAEAAVADADKRSSSYGFSPFRGKKEVGFAAFRGKKDGDYGFSAFRGKKGGSDYADYGFSGFRGRRGGSALGEDYGFSAFRGKKAFGGGNGGIDGFVGFRGKKPAGFVGMRGKRVPDAFNRGETRGKKDSESPSGGVRPQEFLKNQGSSEDILSFLAAMKGALIEPDFELHSTDPAYAELRRRSQRSPLGPPVGFLSKTTQPTAAPPPSTQLEAKKPEDV